MYLAFAFSTNSPKNPKLIAMPHEGSAQTNYEEKNKAFSQLFPCFPYEIF